MTRWAALIAALLATSPAGAQCLGFQCPPGVLGAGTSGAPQPLDTFTQPAAAYSFRKLKSTYSGPAVRLRRTTGGEQDIGFVGVDFDTASATSFCAATTCFGTTWYDQSGNARHQLQATPANQPQLIFNCQGSLPCWRGPASATFEAAGSHVFNPGITSFSAVAARAAADVTLVFAANQLLTTGVTEWATWNGSTALGAPAATGAWHAAVGVINGASSYLRIDGATTTGTQTAVGATGVLSVGVGTGSLGEAIVWANYPLTTAESVALTDNQRNYWTPYTLDTFAKPVTAVSLRKLRSAYSGPAVKLRRTTGGTQDIGFTSVGDFDTAVASTFCAATTCFVDTWYDQSGAGANYTQPTAGQQPAFIFNCNGSLPCIRTTIVQVLTSPSVTPVALQSFSAVGERTGTGLCYWQTNNSFNMLISQNSFAGFWQLSDGTTTIAAAATDGAWHASSGVINGAASVLRIDAAEVTGTIAGSVAAGERYAATQWSATSTTCDQTEAILWQSYALTAGERTALTNNQRNYWAPYTLDSFTQPAAAYSMRRLRSAYTGPAIRIRRASDNLETDINFLGFVPGLGAPLDVAAANAHCAATTCWLRTIYDQSGNLRHLQQATAGSQAQLIFNCNGTLPCAGFSAGQIILTAAAFTPVTGTQSFIVVAQRTLAGSSCILLAGNGFNNRLTTVGANVWGIFGGTGGSIGATANDNVWHAAQAVMAGAASVVNIDGTETAGTATGNVVAGQIYSDANAGATCNKTELVLWDNYQLTAGERAALRGNQRSFWGTP